MIFLQKLYSDMKISQLLITKAEIQLKVHGFVYIFK